MINDLSNKILKMKNKNLVRRILPLTIVSVIGILGLTITINMITKTKNSAEFDIVAQATKYLPASLEEPESATYLATGSDELEAKKNDTESNKNESVTIVARNPYKFWIFRYVFDKLEYDYKTPLSMISNATLQNARDGSEKVIIIVDRDLKKVVSGEELPLTSNAETKAEQISELYNNTKTVAKTRNSEIRTNY